jgi:putative spermidine/putrescine transport system permease protein
MGCSKRICEIYVQSLNKAVKEGVIKGETQFVTTRFGNVLGSNGSVIPLFKKQIKNGGPVTVTDPNIIRMISWIPLLGRNGLVNQGLLDIGIIDKPIEGLLYSDFSVILAFVHLNVLFMIIPIFNSMSRIDRRLLEASYDNGASSLTTLFQVVVPLSKTGIVIGSVFVLTLVMGDFITVKMMSGGLSASVGVLIHNEIGLLQYPAAAANAVVLLITVLMMLALLFRMVDIKKEL